MSNFACRHHGNLAMVGDLPAVVVAVFIFKGVKNIIEKTSDAFKIVPLAMP